MNSEREKDEFEPGRINSPVREATLRSQFLSPEVSSPGNKKSDMDWACAIAAILLDDYQWLGTVTHVNRTSKFDTFVRLIDIFVQLRLNEKILCLGFEISLVGEEEAIDEEILATCRELREGQEYAVKYFDSPTSGKMKNVRMPKVLWAWTIFEIQELMRMLSTLKNSPEEEAIRQFKQHPLRTKFMDRTLGQLRDYGRAAESSNKIEYAQMHQELRTAIEQQTGENLVPEGDPDQRE